MTIFEVYENLSETLHSNSVKEEFARGILKCLKELRESQNSVPGDERTRRPANLLRWRHTATASWTVGRMDE